MARIEFDGVSKTFARHTQRQLLGGYLHGLLKRRQTEKFYALNQVSFRIGRGESVAPVVHGAGPLLQKICQKKNERGLGQFGGL